MRVLFVCTGNTCRSALAEALARRGPAVGDVVFESAGLFALDGAPATPHAVAAAAEAGADLSGHVAATATPERLRAADRVYVMSRAQLEGVIRLGLDPSRVELLDPSGEDIEDPYGADPATYRRVRERIEHAIARRRAEWSGAAGVPPG